MTLRTGNLPRLWLLSHRTSRARLTELLAGARAALDDSRASLAAEREISTMLAAQVDTLEKAAESERQWRLRSLPELLAAAGEVERLTFALAEANEIAVEAAAEARRLRGYVEIVRAREATPATGEGRP